MREVKKAKKVWSRGHVFLKSSDCPICPKCWSGYYRTKLQHDFPPDLAAPALRALLNAKITKLSQLQRWTESDLIKLHGLGPKAIKQLQVALKQKHLSLAGKKV